MSCWEIPLKATQLDLSFLNVRVRHTHTLIGSHQFGVPAWCFVIIFSSHLKGSCEKVRNYCSPFYRQNALAARVKPLVQKDRANKWKRLDSNPGLTESKVLLFWPLGTLPPALTRTYMAWVSQSFTKYRCVLVFYVFPKKAFVLAQEVLPLAGPVVHWKFWYSSSPGGGAWRRPRECWSVLDSCAKGMNIPSVLAFSVAQPTPTKVLYCKSIKANRLFSVSKATTLM